MTSYSNSVIIRAISMPAGKPSIDKLEVLFDARMEPSSILDVVREAAMTMAFTKLSAKLNPIKPVETQKSF